MKKKIILHIGLPKTATTALQKWCHKHRLDLRHAGVDYPDAIESEVDPKHQFLVHELKSGNFRKLSGILQSSLCDKMFLSTEGLSNNFQDFSDGQFALFRNAVSEYEVIIFVVSRDWSSWIRSYYNQSVVNPPTSGYPYATQLSLEDFSELERVRFLGNLPNQQDKLRSSFGATEIVVAKFEQDWVSTWSCLMGLSPSDVILPRANESLEPEVVFLILRLNRANISIGARNIILSAIQRATGAENTILKSYENMPSAEADKIGRAHV